MEQKMDENIVFNDIANCLTYICETYGMEVVKNNKVLKSLLSDLYANDNNSLQLIKIAIDANVVKNIANSNKNNVYIVAKKEKSKLMNSFFLSENFAEQVIEWILLSFNYKQTDIENKFKMSTYSTQDKSLNKFEEKNTFAEIKSDKNKKHRNKKITRKKKIDKSEPISILYILLGLFIPIIAFIAFFFVKKDHPRNARIMMLCSIIMMIISYILPLIISSIPYFQTLFK